MIKQEDYQRMYRCAVDAAKASEEAYKKLTPAQRRVLIARDVLAWCHLKAFEPTGSSYGRGALTATDDFRDLRERFVTEGVPCYGCAKAAIFFSGLMRRGGPLDWTFYANRSDGYDEWDDVPAELSDIERAFEVWSDSGNFVTDNVPPEVAHDWLTYGRNLPDGKRLQMIAQHIIKHEGTFHYSAFVTSEPVQEVMRQVTAILKPLFEGRDVDKGKLFEARERVLEMFQPKYEPLTLIYPDVEQPV